METTHQTDFSGVKMLPEESVIAVLNPTEFNNTSLQLNALFLGLLHCTVLTYYAGHCTALQVTALHYTELHYTALSGTTLLWL